MDWWKGKGPRCDLPQGDRSKLVPVSRDSHLGRWRAARNFMFIDDCIQGTELIMHSDVTEPLNMGSSEWLLSTDLWISLRRSPASEEFRRRGSRWLHVLWADHTSDQKNRIRLTATGTLRISQHIAMLPLNLSPEHNMLLY